MLSEKSQRIIHLDCIHLYKIQNSGKLNNILFNNILHTYVMIH